MWNFLNLNHVSSSLHILGILHVDAPYEVHYDITLFCLHNPLPMFRHSIYSIFEVNVPSMHAPVWLLLATYCLRSMFNKI